MTPVTMSITYGVCVAAISLRYRPVRFCIEPRDSPSAIARRATPLWKPRDQNRSSARNLGTLYRAPLSVRSARSSAIHALSATNSANEVPSAGPRPLGSRHLISKSDLDPGSATITRIRSGCMVRIHRWRSRFGSRGSPNMRTSLIETRRPPPCSPGSHTTRSGIMIGSSSWARRASSRGSVRLRRRTMRPAGM